MRLPKSEPHDLKEWNSADWRYFWIAIGFSFLVSFAQTRSFELMFDGLTYVALAKNILKTGDWRVLHYNVEQYADFYQHPPLAIWMQALVFRIFGDAEPVSRYLSSAFLVLTSGAVFGVARSFFGRTAALFSVLVLITSTRWIKWGTNFYLDGILGAFCFLSFWAWMRFLSRSKTSWWALISGLLAAGAVMTKGVVGFAAIGAVGIVGLFFLSRRIWAGWLFFVLGVSLPIVLWVGFLDGGNFIRNYWMISAQRAQAHEFHLWPWENLLNQWWPWIAVFCGSIFWMNRSRAWWPLFISALSFPLAFSFGGQFMEHYLTPFYPFAAVVVGSTIARVLDSTDRIFDDRWVKRLTGALLFCSLWVATLAPSFHGSRPAPIFDWLRELRALPHDQQKAIQQIAFSSEACEIWYCMANIQARTDYQMLGDFALNRKPPEKTVLVTLKAQVPDPTWIPMPCLYVPGFQAYRSPDLEGCR